MIVKFTKKSLSFICDQTTSLTVKTIYNAATALFFCAWRDTFFLSLSRQELAKVHADKFCQKDKPASHDTGEYNYTLGFLLRTIES